MADEPAAKVPDEAAPVSSAHRTATLDDAECRALLARQRLCVMAVVDGDEPYAVPLYYGFDGNTVYLGVAEGRKTRALDRNPRVCVVVTEVGPGDAWRSVEVAGRVTILTDAADRERAINVLITHHRRPERAGRGQVSDHTAPRSRAGGCVVRIDHAVITGRASGSVQS